MRPTSVRLDPDVVDELDAEADDRGLSRNRYIQQVIDERHAHDGIQNEYSQLQNKFQQLRRDYSDLEARKEEIENELQALKTKHRREDERWDALRERRNELKKRARELEIQNDRLQREFAVANSKQDDLGELVEYVEGEKSLRERREERESAPVWRRTWWWVAGAPSD